MTSGKKTRKQTHLIPFSLHFRQDPCEGSISHLTLRSLHASHANVNLAPPTLLCVEAVLSEGVDWFDEDGADIGECICICRSEGWKTNGCCWNESTLDSRDKSASETRPSWSWADIRRGSLAAQSMSSSS
jgi:hypothetical protein